MNQQSAANVLSSIGGELPSHLKGQEETTTAEFLANAIGSGKDDAGNDALFKRMSEVAVRRVARAKEELQLTRHKPNMRAEFLL